MYAVSVDTELAAYAALPITHAQDLARVSFPARREVVEAARVSNPAAPLAYYAANHTTVVAAAQQRAKANIR